MAYQPSLALVCEIIVALRRFPDDARRQNTRAGYVQAPRLCRPAEAQGRSLKRS